MRVLEVEQLEVAYGGNTVLRQVTLHVDQYETVALVGANGAGKTTLLKSIMGTLPTSGGEVRLRGERLGSLRPYRIASRGVTLVPEGRQIFPGMTVLENVEVAIASLRLSRAERSRRIEEMWELFPVLLDRRSQQGWSLSGGEQQMVALARGLARDPSLLLLDEPTLGLAPQIVEGVVEVIRRIAARKGTVLIVEQNAAAAMALAERVYVLQNGRIVLEGTPDAVRGNALFRQAYLGVAEPGSSSPRAGGVAGG